MKIKKILLISNTLVSITIPLASISCAKTTFNINVNKPWNTNEPNFNFFNEIIEQYNKLALEQGLKKIEKYKINYRGKNNDLSQDIIKGSADLATITSGLFNKNADELTPLVQTLTKAFNFDLEESFYKDGSENDSLRKIAKATQNLFEKKSFKDWDHTEYNWDGSKFNYFYSDKLINFYRGSVLAWGDKDTIQNIKKAWDEKDWNKFRNYGILMGKETSASKYQLQEILFKKHFNLPNNKFTSFALDKAKNYEKYKIDNAKNLSKGENKNYHIVFDGLAAFAYTNNFKTGKKLDYYRCENPNHKIEFLTATDPLRYNVFATSKHLPKKQRDLLSKSIFEVWKNKKDDYGENVGFNGYEIIKDPYKEVILPYKRVFGNE